MTEKNENVENEQVEINPKELIDSVSLKLGDEEAEKLEKKKNKVISQVKEKTEDVTKELFSEFSSFMEKVADATVEKATKQTIPTGIDLVDAILGGGFIVGGLGIIVGQPGSGKSMLAIQTLAQGQLKCGGTMLGGYLDSEEATTAIRLANLGVRYPKMNPYTDVTVEKVFKFLEGLSVFKDKKGLIDDPSVVVWDSIANTLSQKEREVDDPNSVIGYKARLLSILIPKYVSICAKHNICFLAVNQLRDVLNLGMFAPPKDLKFMSQTKDMPGGNILKYNAFQLVEMKVKSAIAGDKAEKYGFEGIICKLKCVKNKLFSPNVEIDVVGSFTTGFSNFWTNYNFLKETKRLNAGAWNYLVSYPDKKFRTKDAPDLYKNDEDFRKAFDEAAAEAIQTDIIDKYNPKIDDENDKDSD
jgi:RecA/RadA recombinase